MGRTKKTIQSSENNMFMNIVGMALLSLNLNIVDAKQYQKRRLLGGGGGCGVHKYFDNNKLN